MGKEKKASISFDVRKVRPKHSVMGRAIQAQETARGQKRNYAAAKGRDATLGLDFERRRKGAANVVVDKRAAGAKGRFGGAQERMLAKWHAERVRSKAAERKAKKYNLDDDEEEGANGFVLTHGGRVLGENEEDYKEMPEGFEERLEEQLDEGEEDEFVDVMGEGGIDAVIARSKQKKMERAKERLEKEKMIGQLDDDWSELSALIMENKRGNEREDDDLEVLGTEVVRNEETGEMETVVTVRERKPEEKVDTEMLSSDEEMEEEEEESDDDFDSLVAALSMESKGKASDRLKKPEELARERVEALEALEAQRLKRQLDGGAMDEDEVFDADDVAEEQRLARDRMKALGRTEADSASGQLTFPVPKTAEEWLELAKGRSPREKELVVRRILACNHPSLTTENLAALVNFLGVLLDQCLVFTAEETEVARAEMDALFLSCSFLSKELGGEVVVKLFTARLHTLFFKYTTDGKVPTGGELMFFKFCFDIFPASDFRHVVTTPLQILLGAALAKARKNLFDRETLVAALFMCNLVLYATLQSSLFSSEAYTFLSQFFAELPAKIAPFKNEKPVALPLPIFVQKVKDMEEGVFLVSCASVALRLVQGFAPLWLKIDESVSLGTLMAKRMSVLALTAPDSLRALVSETREKLSNETEEAVAEEPVDPKFPTFRTVERRNVEQQKEFMPRITDQKYARSNELSTDIPASAQQAKIRRLKRSIHREQKAMEREVRKDSAYLSARLAQEAAEENAQIKESMGRIRNLLQDEQHQAKLELNAKAGHNKKLRL